MSRVYRIDPIRTDCTADIRLHQDHERRSDCPWCGDEMDQLGRCARRCERWRAWRQDGDE